ncbi:octanoyl-[GcvH]:protein N-octanoyltransferase [Granulicatella balaenopterae]|uniref:Octanoyl-[GcvH]:protein N-octanoyltransferase n=1 Tax=Granulicatella balaenopterae TaxID=137733 RepID=A0A1H9M1P4_9LACT|nr:lipoate--protein ligase family protein [Granulicatella balaenopterae]SER17397.1 octanoyl-[GcvH]:protein N-octanoyltransferase [Granulicatella balaenopterae]
MTMLSILKNQDIFVISEHSDKYFNNYLHPFIVDEVCLRKVNLPNSLPIIHFWTLPPCLILGMSDTKLPFLNDALINVKNAHYQPVIRSAGGLAVISDPGVLNISLTFKQCDTKISIHEAYQVMKELICLAFPEASGEKCISSFEVSDSYCPGDFDLSIQGKKFAGIAQRRFKDGICVLIYLSVFGQQEQRGELVKSFYQTGLNHQESKWHFPDITPSSMANLADLLEIELSIDDVYKRILMALLDNDCNIISTYKDFYQTDDYHQLQEKMQQRNQLITNLGMEDFNED